MSLEAHQEGRPHDRLTDLANKVIEGATLPEGVKMIVFLNDDDRSGIGIHNYMPEGAEEHDEEALREASLEATVDLFIHLKAMFEANGKTLQILPVHGRPQG